MSVQWSQESAYAKEARQWEMDFSQYGPPGRPRIFEEFPKRLYKAGRKEKSGVPVILDAIDVENAQQEANMQSRGYRFGQDAALEALHASDNAVSKLAANRAFNDRKMSPKAQAEAAEVDESTSRHLAEIPALPITHRVPVAPNARKRAGPKKGRR